jgi:hypothetical protein
MVTGGCVAEDRSQPLAVEALQILAAERVIGPSAKQDINAVVGVSDGMSRVVIAGRKPEIFLAMLVNQNVIGCSEMNRVVQVERATTNSRVVNEVVRVLAPLPLAVGSPPRFFDPDERLLRDARVGKPGLDREAKVPRHILENLRLAVQIGTQTP